MLWSITGALISEKFFTLAPISTKKIFCLGGYCSEKWFGTSFGDLSQSENLSEIRPPSLSHKIIEILLMDWTILSTNFEFYALIGHILFFEVYDHSSVVFIETKYLNNYLIKNAHLTDLKVVSSSRAVVVKRKRQLDSSCKKIRGVIMEFF